MSERYDEALDELRQLANDCRSRQQETCYGFFCGGDPRSFSPDPEGSTEAERAAHAEACKRWDAGSREPIPMPQCSRGPLDAPTGFGLGVSTFDDETMSDIAERLERILNRLENP